MPGRVPGRVPHLYSGSNWAGLRVGLMGGSFNPAHDGHRHLSLLALKRLKLHAVWWLVTPQNPLKAADGMAPLALRLERARLVADHPRLLVTDLETRLGTRFTADTLGALTKRFARTRFVWLMGADNLIQLSQWDQWTRIFHLAPIAIFDRPTYSQRALSGPAASHYMRYRIRERLAGRLADLPPPAWAFLHSRLHWASATKLREQSPPGGA